MAEEGRVWQRCDCWWDGRSDGYAFEIPWGCIMLDDLIERFVAAYQLARDCWKIVCASLLLLLLPLFSGVACVLLMHSFIAPSSLDQAVSAVAGPTRKSESSRYRNAVKQRAIFNIPILSCLEIPARTVSEGFFTTNSIPH